MINSNFSGSLEKHRLSGSRQVDAFRIAFITDVHIQPERTAAADFKVCMENIYNQAPLPQLILNGGDTVMDAVAAELGRVDELWAVWREALQDFQEIPIYYCLGNHDIWGWSKKSGCKGDEPLFGKEYFLKVTGLERTYYSFEAGGWCFIVLDSLLRLDAVRYTACLDAEQRTWLEGVLNRTDKKTPVVILSHIPIMGAASVFFANSENTTKREAEINIARDWVVPSWQMHADALSLIDLFAGHENVKLCLSGHTHINDSVLYRDIAFINGGAVCGQWWRGEFFGTPPGYMVLDLYRDGGFGGGYIPLKFSN